LRDKRIIFIFMPKWTLFFIFFKKLFILQFFEQFLIQHFYQT
jgi:hypothetical protein